VNAPANPSRPATKAGAGAPAPKAPGLPSWEWLAFAALLAPLYWPTLGWMVGRWNEDESYHSHGFLIPLVSAFLAWGARPEAAAAAADAGSGGRKAGFLIALSAALLHLLAGVEDVNSISGFTLVPLIFGFAVMMLGWRGSRPYWFAIAYLWFMVPLPDFVTSGLNFRLKLVAADLATSLLNLAGLPAIREGSYMLFGEEKLAVGDVCSGLRSLLSLIALGVLYAWLVRAKGWLHVLAVAAAIVPAAVMGNGLRIFVVSGLVYFLGTEPVFKPLFGDVDAHLLTGGIIFAGAFLTLFAVSSAMDALTRRKGKAP
jgi:exosortase